MMEIYLKPTRLLDFDRPAIRNLVQAQAWERIGAVYDFVRDRIVFGWAEVLHQGRWTALEGVILDLGYLSGLRATLPPETRELIGFGVGIDDLRSPPAMWKGTDTFVQIKGVNSDLGIYDDPNSFYAKLKA